MKAHERAAIETEIHLEKLDVVVEEPKGALERLGELIWGAAEAVYEQAGNIFDAGVGIVGDAIEGARHGLDRMTFESGMMHPRDDYSVKSADLYGAGADPAVGSQEIAKPEVGTADLFGDLPTHEERIATAEAYEHAKNAPGIRGEMEDFHDVETRDLFKPMPRAEPGIHGSVDADQARFEASMQRAYGEMAPPTVVEQIDHAQEQNNSPDR